MSSSGRRSARLAIGCACAALLVLTGLAAVHGGADDVPAAVPAGSSRFVPITPVRLVDSRVASQPALLGTIADNTAVPIQVTGQQGLPTSGVSAIVANLTVVGTTGPGYVQAFPTGQAAIGSSSNLNVNAAGQSVAAMAVVPVGDNGRISVYLQRKAALIVDVFGYYTPSTSTRAGRYQGLTPARILDSRTGTGQSAPGAFAAGQARKLVVQGRGGLPATNVAAVVVNLTVVQPSGPGFVSAVSSSAAVPPPTSNVNVEAPGQTRANLAVVPLGPDGAITVYASMATHVLADVAGYVTATGAASSTDGLFVPVTPSRLLDSRAGLGYTGPKPGPGTSINEPVAGRNGVPASGAAAVTTTITATQTTAPGFVTAWPDGEALPNTSTLNATAPGQTIANAAFVTLGGSGAMDLYTQSGTHLLADVSGYFLGSGSTSPPTTISPTDTDAWAYWGYLYSDGTFDTGSGTWLWDQEPYFLPESATRFVQGATDNGIVVKKRPSGAYVTVTTPHPPLPDMHGRPNAEVAAFMAAVVEDEGDACSGLIDDDPSQAHVQYLADLLTQLGVTWKMTSSGGGTFWDLYADKASWPIVQSWPYATTIRTPGVGTLIC